MFYIFVDDAKSFAKVLPGLTVAVPLPTLLRSADSQIRMSSYVTFYEMTFAPAKPPV